MLYVKRSVELTKPFGDYPREKPINLREGEHGETTILFEVFNNNVAYDLTGKTAFLCVQFEDGTWYKPQVTVNKNVASYVVDNTLTAQEGKAALCYLEIQGDINITSGAVGLWILKSLDISEEEAQERENNIDRLMQEFRDSAKTNLDNIEKSANSKVDDALAEFVTIKSTTVEYASGNSPTAIPSGGWTSTPGAIAQGTYLWTRVITKYNQGADTVSYSVAYQGVDGNVLQQEAIDAINAKNTEQDASIKSLETAWDSVNQIDEYNDWLIAKAGKLCVMRRSIVYSQDAPLKIDQPTGSIFQSEPLTLDLPPTSIVRFRDNQYCVGLFTPTYGGCWFYFGGEKLRLMRAVKFDYHGLISIFVYGLLA